MQNIQETEEFCCEYCNTCFTTKDIKMKDMSLEKMLLAINSSIKLPEDEELFDYIYCTVLSVNPKKTVTTKNGDQDLLLPAGALEVACGIPGPYVPERGLPVHGDDTCRHSVASVPVAVVC